MMMTMTNMMITMPMITMTEIIKILHSMVCISVLKNKQTNKHKGKLPNWKFSFSIDTFPRGFFLFPGYMKIPPYTNVLCMSDTIEPT